MVDNPSINGIMRTIYFLNPMVHFIEAYRAIFYHLRSPGAEQFFYMFISAAATMSFGMWLFRKLEAKFAEEL